MKTDKEYTKILEKIDKAKDNSEEILPLIYELNLLMNKNEESFKGLFLNTKDKLTERVFKKTKKYVFGEWINYKKERDKVK